VPEVIVGGDGRIRCGLEKKGGKPSKDLSQMDTAPDIYSHTGGPRRFLLGHNNQRPPTTLLSKSTTYTSLFHLPGAVSPAMMVYSCWLDRLAKGATIAEDIALVSRTFMTARPRVFNRYTTT